MIMPLPVRIIGDIGMFGDYPNITNDPEADIILMDKDEEQKIGKYNIAKFFPTNNTHEVWVDSLEQKIELKRAGIIKPIIIMTKDKELLPAMMMDRLVYLQDKINKEHEKHNG
jgi:hypothetical protein